MTSPFGRLVIIANPASGRGRSEAELRTIETALRDWGLDYRIVPTTGPGHAAEAAAAALRDGDRFLVAAGGDGTVHEVVNGMVAGDQPIAPDAVLGVLATGSGRDFVRSFGIPGDAVRAARTPSYSSGTADHSAATSTVSTITPGAKARSGPMIWK